MNDRTLDQALDMTPADRAELRARVEKLTRGHADYYDGVPDGYHVVEDVDGERLVPNPVAP